MARAQKRVLERIEPRLFLLEWRRYRKLSQQALAERAGVSQGMISQLENDHSDYTGELLKKLSAALGCEPADLLTRDPRESESIWSLWRALRPNQRGQALRVLKALVDDSQ